MLDLPPSSTEKHEVQSIPELANLFSGELDLIGFSHPARTPQVFSDTSSCGDAVPQLGSSSQSSSGPFSDAQILYFTPVQDGDDPKWLLESLVKNVEMEATKQARNSYRDEVQSAIWVRERKKAEERTAKEHRQAFDLLAHVAALRARRFKNRLQRTLAAGANARRDAEELERSRWVHALALILSPTDTPTGKLLTAQQTSFQFLGAGLRASTLRGNVRTVKKFMSWLGLTHQLAFPTSHLQYAQYLEVMQSEPANRGALKQCHAAFQFLETAAGLPDNAKLTTSELELMYKECLRRAAPGRPSKQARRMIVEILAAMEVFVMDQSKPKYLRIFGWWVLLQNWGTLRFSDHRGLLPEQISVSDRGFLAVLAESRLGSPDGSCKLQARLLIASPDFESSGLLTGRTPLLSRFRDSEQIAVLTPFSVDAAIGTTAGTFLDASLGAFIHAFLHFTPGLREVTA